MHKASSIIDAPLLGALALSVAVHVAVFHGRAFSFSTPARPAMAPGRTVVRLTLAPSPASQPAPPPAPKPEPVPPLAPAPVPTPVVETPVPPAPMPMAKPEPQPEPFVKEPAPSAQQQDGSVAPEKGVVTDASTTGVFKPTYPRISRQRGEEGAVVLSVEVSADGSVGQVAVACSSGYHRLDDAAVQAARKTVFVPATRFGRNVASTLELTFVFRLTDD